MTASPRKTCVPGVHAYAADGSSTSAATASTDITANDRPCLASVARRFDLRMLNAQALSPTPSRTEPRPRDIVLGRRGIAVVAISHVLLGVYFRVQLELIDVLVFSCRKLRPIAGLGQGRGARAYAANRRRGRDEHLLR